MPSERREMPAAVLDGKIFITGGFGDARTVLSSVLVYDPEGDQWTSVSPMPEPRHHHAAAAVNGKLYVIGGYSALDPYPWPVTPTVFEFDPETGAWRSRAPLPQLLGAPAAAASNGKIYVFGGASGTNTLSTTFIYEPSTDSWSVGEPLNPAREHVYAAVIDSRIFVAGGRFFNSANLDALQSYTPATDSWETLAPLQMARSGHGVAALNGRLYVFGGESLTAGVRLNTVEIYDPAQNAWSWGPQLSAGLTGLATATIGERIHLLEDSREVRLVGESGLGGNAGEGLRAFGELPPGVLHPQPAQVLSHAEPMILSTRHRGVPRTLAGAQLRGELRLGTAAAAQLPRPDWRIA